MLLDVLDNGTPVVDQAVHFIDNLVCRIVDFECTAQTGLLYDDKVVLHVFVCHEIRVEAVAVIEIMAQACKPRPNFLPAPPRLLPLHCMPTSPP